MEYLVKSREITVGLLNGMYKMLTAGNYELITENVYKCPQKVADPMVRAFLDYGYMMPEKTLHVLMECFALYKSHFMSVSSDEEMTEVISEATKVAEKFTMPEEKHYAKKVLSVFIDEIEMAYKQAAETKNVA